MTPCVTLKGAPCGRGVSNGKIRGGSSEEVKKGNATWKGLLKPVDVWRRVQPNTNIVCVCLMGMDVYFMGMDVCFMGV